MVVNPLDTAIEVNFSVKAPPQWNVKPVDSASVPGHSEYYLRVQAVAPSSKLAGWQGFAVSAESGGKNIGTVPIRVELSTGWVAPQ